MEAGFISLMRKLAPDLTDEMTRRALILERISALQPIGRRQLASRRGRHTALCCDHILVARRGHPPLFQCRGCGLCLVAGVFAASFAPDTDL